MTENAYPETTEPAPAETPTSVRVPNVSAHARSGIDGTVLGSAAEDGNAVSTHDEPETADHPSQPDADAASETVGEVYYTEGDELPPAGSGSTTEHPSQDDTSTTDPAYDVPAGDSEAIYAWVVGTGDEDAEVVTERQAAALAAEQAKPDADQDPDLIALLTPTPDAISIEKQGNADPDPDLTPEQQQVAAGTPSLAQEQTGVTQELPPTDPGTATTGEPMHASGETPAPLTDVTAPADQQGAAPTP